LKSLKHGDKLNYIQHRRCCSETCNYYHRRDCGYWVL